MGKKYVAMVMDRHYVGEDAFVFHGSHAVIGELDEETGIFKERHGNEYAPMLSPNLMQSEIPYAFSEIIELSKIREEIGQGLSLQESISEYEFLCRKNLYLVAKKDDGVFCVRFNLDTIKEQINQHNAEEEEVEEDDLNPMLKKIVLDMLNGVYSLSELKEIRDQLKDSCDDFEWAIDSIEMQIEATESGTSLLELANDYSEEEPQERPQKKSKSERLREVITESNSVNMIDIEELFQQVTKTLIAQDEPARRVIVELARKELDDRKKKEGILLTGHTGSGKTLMMELIAKYLDRPFKKVDSNQLTTAGYAGKDIEEVLWDLYIECGRDVDKAEQAIIFFDEIDKKGSSRKDDHSGQGVLNLLLPFIEGMTYDACENMRTSKESVKIDTSNMIVILGGAFTDVYRNLVEKSIGFNKVVSSKPSYRIATTKDFIEKGMMTDEFMGRVTVIKLNDLDVDAIKRVMLESDGSAMQVQEAIFRRLGVKITFTDDYTTEIARQAHEKGTGARGLNPIIDETTWKAFYDVYTHPGEYEEVILDKQTVEDNEHYQLVKKKGH